MSSFRVILPCQAAPGSGYKRLVILVDRVSRLLAAPASWIHLLGVGQQAMDRWRRRERASGRKGKTDRHERKNEELAEGENNRTRTRIAELERI